jgi:hypothetical protein
VGLFQDMDEDDLLGELAELEQVGWGGGRRVCCVRCVSLFAVDTLLAVS